MKVSEILRAGKQALLDRGWCQGDIDSIGGSKCCAATALVKAPISNEWILGDGRSATP